MLSVWPIHFLSLLAYFFLRVVIGMILFYLGWKHFLYINELKHIFRLSWWPWGNLTVWLLAGGELIAATLITVGAYTQVVALLVALMSLKMFFIRNWFHHHTIPGRLFYFLLFGASLSLVITGAGFFAVDLPL